MDEETAAEALKNGKLSGVGVDTIQMEIVDGVFTFDSPLPTPGERRPHPPHRGAIKEALIRANITWVDNVSRFLNGEEPLHMVNDVRPLHK